MPPGRPGDRADRPRAAPRPTAAAARRPRRPPAAPVRREFALLVALPATPGDVVAPNRPAREVWSEDASANLVQVYISHLRRKIGADRIRTVRGAGYELEA